MLTARIQAIDGTGTLTLPDFQPCRLLTAAHGSFPTLSPTVCPWMLDPLPRRYTACSRLLLPRCHRPSPTECGSACRVYPANDFLQGNFRGRRYFVMFRPPSLLAPPDRSYRCEYCRRAA